MFQEHLAAEGIGNLRPALLTVEVRKEHGVAEERQTGQINPLRIQEELGMNTDTGSWLLTKK